MPILFSAIALSRVVLAKFATCDGNFEDIAEEVVSKIPVCDNKLTYSHGRYLLHYIKEVECVFFCITDRTCQRSRAFLFLNEIRRQYEKNGSDIAKILAHEMYRYNEDYGTIVIRSGELEELNSIGVESSECILGEKMLFVENDHNLRYTTTSYTDAPQTVEVSEVKRKPNYVKNIIMAVIFLGLSCIFFYMTPIYIIIVITCVLYAFQDGYFCNVLQRFLSNFIVYKNTNKT